MPGAPLAVLLGVDFVSFRMVDRVRPMVAMTAILLAVCGCAAAFGQHGCTLLIRVDGLRNHKGVVGALVFTSPAGWPEDVSKSFRHEAVPIDPSGHSATVVIKNMPPGDYGIVVLHDENENMKLDRNMFGFPKEGFGFANNPRVGFTAPVFGRAVMHVGCPETDTTIRIIYK